MPKNNEVRNAEVRDSEVREPDISDTTHSYEQARDELAEVVMKLEAGGITLEESLALWERGEKLANICQEWLDGARRRLAAITPKPADAE